MSTTCSPTSSRLSPQETKALENILMQRCTFEAAFKAFVDNTKNQIKSPLNKTSTETVIYDIPTEASADLWNKNEIETTDEGNQNVSLIIIAIGTITRTAFGKGIVFAASLVTTFFKIFPNSVLVYPKYQVHFKTTYCYKDGVNGRMYGRYTVKFERIIYDSSGSIKEHKKQSYRVSFK
jgi:hypothetical protein